jgi:hypothetical protein
MKAGTEVGVEAAGSIYEEGIFCSGLLHYIASGDACELCDNLPITLNAFRTQLW